MAVDPIRFALAQTAAEVEARRLGTVYPDLVGRVVAAELQVDDDGTVHGVADAVRAFLEDRPGWNVGQSTEPARPRGGTPVQDYARPKRRPGTGPASASVANRRLVDEMRKSGRYSPF